MTPTHSHLARGGRFLACLLAVGTCLSSPAALAQDYYVVPWVTVETLYDDNIFFDTEDQVSDWITRVSPQLDVGYDSGTLNWLLSYRNDAEWYRDLSDLDSTTARGFGFGNIEYLPNRRWSLTGNTEYVQTNSVQDLTLTPGGGIPGRVGRAEAERFLLGGGVNYRFTPNLSGGLDLTWVDDQLIDISETETRSADALVEQILTPTRTLRYAYRYRDYDFTREIETDPSVIIRDTDDSHTLWVGLTQVLSETSDLELRAGPRFSTGDDDDVEPYILVSWNRDYARGNTVLEAVWDETTLLGEVGRVESKSIAATWNHEFTADFEVRSRASYASLSGTGYEADIASFDVSGIYRFNRFAYVTARYGFNTQDVVPIAVSRGRIDHNVVSLAITFTRPRPVEERSSN